MTVPKLDRQDWVRRPLLMSPMQWSVSLEKAVSERTPQGSPRDVDKDARAPCDDTDTKDGL